MQQEKLSIPYPVIVEGKYDKITLSSVIEAQIIPVGGFSIFKKSETAALLRRLAQKSKLILLTDSDGAGKLIRSHLTGILPRDAVIQLYTPQIHGKERRKSAPSAAGFLGVEGMDAARLRALFLPYASDPASASLSENPLSKQDFYRDGLSGAENSSRKRAALAACFDLPTDMTANALLAALRMLCTYEEYRAAVARIESVPDFSQNHRK